MLESFINWVVNITLSLGYFGLAFAMAIESTFIPLPSELILLPAGYLWYKGLMNPILILLFVVIGSLIGSFFSYWLGEKIGRPFVEKHKKWFFLNDSKIQKIDSFFERFGSAGIFFARLIIGIRHFSSFFAGFAKTPKSKFTIYTVLGSGLWSIFLVCLGYFIGTQEELIKPYIFYFTALIIAIVCLAAIIFGFKNYRKKRKLKKEFGVVVKDSKIHGNGVYALRDFKKGECVIDWSKCSKELTKDQVDKLSKSEKRYVSCLSKNKWVLFDAPAKYVNHSCNPNTKAKDGCDVAIRSIKKGEEITADYIFEKADIDFKCNCGSKNCISLKKKK